ncbi:MAG TPA: ABC transporter permease [Aggregatilinea sp.]|jgi:ABC-type antimicrobial peptide transport system permease subunit|uniref:ABC transporter permease n=1 Tax=Aggregatilinea sp. TaxID=2806333 RepID=UPI002C693672|nr:FtsX-like permease family protein [Aggregatilinea sp.]HML20902.1 ABC transporter permease [Aggregatilinea sp.]
MIGRLWFYVRHSLNDLRVNRQRSFFAMLCIAAGVGAIVSLQTLGVMINKTLTGSLQESNRGDLRLVPNDDWGSVIIEQEDSMESTVFTADGVERVRRWFDEHYPGAVITYRQSLSGLGAGWSAYDLDRDTSKALIIGLIVDAQVYPVYGQVRSLDGGTLDQLLQGPGDIVLSQNLAEPLEAEIGDEIRIAGASGSFILRGIVPTDAEAGFRNSATGFLAGMFGFYYLDHSATTQFAQTQPGLSGELYVRLADPDQVDVVQRQFQRAFWAVSVASTSDLNEQNSAISGALDNLVVTMGLVSVLIGGIGIINTMLVIVSRRTTEVAVLKTLGLQPDEITILFMMEALIMGVLGSLLGIALGWGLALVTKGFAETFLGQSLAFEVAFRPAFNGFVIGVIITVVFGFLPTLAAGQIRPALVLRPGDTVLPKAGRVSAFVALIALVMALSLVAQGLMGDLLDGITYLHTITTAIGAVCGALIALSLVMTDYLSMRGRRRGRHWLTHFLGWIAMLAVLPAGGAVFGNLVPAILLVTLTGVFVTYLYIIFWVIVWAAGGGTLSEIRAGLLLFVIPLFWPLIPLLLVIAIPVWLLGRLIQRFAFVDLKIAMRGMLATKGRGASTLLALVIGIFTLSVITMLVDSITNAFEDLLEELSGGNAIVFAATGSTEMIDTLRTTLDGQSENLNGYAIVAAYNGRLMSYYDASAGREIRLQPWVAEFLNPISGRDINANLPDAKFEAGRNLDPAIDNQPDAEGRWPVVVQQYDPETGGGPGPEFGVGDVITVRPESGSEPLAFEVVGVISQSGISMEGAQIYAPLAAFGGYQPNEVTAVLDIRESELRSVRRALAEVPGVFMIETRFVNDLVNRIVDQFTSFPILVAALSLFVGGFVIANSVALSTMERRREIAVMKAVGWQRERVLGMLLLEHGLLGFIGGLIGVGISFVILLLVLYQMFRGDLGNKIPYGIAFALMGLCILISLVAAIASVWTASGEKPLNTLRYE